MKSSFLPKYERKIVRISALFSVAQNRAEILKICGSYFWRNDGFINSFWNFLTFMMNNNLIQPIFPLKLLNWHFQINMDADSLRQSKKEKKCKAVRVERIWSLKILVLQMSFFHFTCPEVFWIRQNLIFHLRLGRQPPSFPVFKKIVVKKWFPNAWV